MANGTTYFGEELKYRIDIQADGFSMDTDDFEIELSCGSKRKTLKNADVLMDLEGNRYITIDTSEFKRGDLYATTYAYVPDSDFPDGKRTEIDKQRLTTIIAK